MREWEMSLEERRGRVGGEETFSVEYYAHGDVEVLDELLESIQVKGVLNERLINLCQHWLSMAQLLDPWPWRRHHLW